MSTFEVTEPILNSPFAESAQHWWILVNAEGSFGAWQYAVAKQVSEVPKILSASTRA